MLLDVGSATSPGYSFDGDTDTGFYRDSSSGGIGLSDEAEMIIEVTNDGTDSLASVFCDSTQAGASECLSVLTSASGHLFGVDTAGANVTGTLGVTGVLSPAGNIGASPPATCTAGTIWIDTDETVDTNCTTTADNSLCLCVATDTWAALENN